MDFGCDSPPMMLGRFNLTSFPRVPHSASADDFRCATDLGPEVMIREQDGLEIDKDPVINEFPLPDTTADKGVPGKTRVLLPSSPAGGWHPPSHLHPARILQH